MKNISNTHNCFGCGVCAISCSKRIINIRLNTEGFYEPYITEPEKCVDCGLCLAVCSYVDNELSLKVPYLKAYAAWSKDSAVRKKCSSGGVGFEVGHYLLENGYKVVGCRYNAEKNKAEHYMATTVEEFIPSIGSKYIQSYTIDGFQQINRKEKYLVTGTPCQIDSFRRYIQKFHCEDNFVLMDFFCHGVPSKLMWNRYVEWAQKRVGKLTYVSWRNKHTGWHDSWAMAIDGEVHGEKVNWHDSYNMLIEEKKSYLNSRWSQGDLFYKFFLSDICQGQACYNRCKFKYNKSAADIRIGDLWGKTYQNDDIGVSAVVAFTHQGEQIIHSANLELRNHSFEIVAEGQMKQNVPKAPMRSTFLSLLRLHIPFIKIWGSILVKMNYMLR